MNKKYVVYFTFSLTLASCDNLKSNFGDALDGASTKYLSTQNEDLSQQFEVDNISQDIEAFDFEVDEFEDSFEISEEIDTELSSEAGVEAHEASQATAPAYQCKAPRHYSYSISQLTSLYCNSYIDLFNTTIPDKGRAVAIFRGSIFNYQAAGRPYAIHSWSGYASIGGGGRVIASGSGESICGQQYGTVQLMSYGELTEGSQNLSVKLQQYVSSGCSNGSLAVMPGATIDVWVEDDHPDCVGKSIVANSYFRKVWDVSGVGTEAISHPQTYIVPVLDASLSVKKDRPVRVYSQVQTSVDSTHNRCGAQYETAGAYLSTSGVYSQASNYANVLPVSGGITHGLYYPSIMFTPTADGVLSASLSAYVNQTKNAGGVSKIGQNYSGDTLLFIIQE